MRVSCLAFCNSRRKKDSLAERTFLSRIVLSKRPATASGCGGAGPSASSPLLPDAPPASPSSRLLASDPAALATPPTPFFSNLLWQIQRAYDLGLYLPPGRVRILSNRA